MKPDCYKCKYRGDLEGSEHSCCQHPAISFLANPYTELLGILASVRRIPPIQMSGGIVIKGSPHGIKNGWFNHPFNFDPLWLEECSGFDSKE